MFKTNNPSTLRRHVDAIAIPAFVADRRTDDDQFEIRALNTAHEQITGLAMHDVAGKPLADIFPPEDASAATAQYNACINAKDPVQVRQELHLPQGKLVWDATLFHLALPGGLRRIVGTCVVVQQMRRDVRDCLAFRNVDYYAATSAMRLNQITEVLSDVDAGRMPPERLVRAAGLLASLCRSVDHTLEAMRGRAAGARPAQPAADAADCAMVALLAQDAA